MRRVNASRVSPGAKAPVSASSATEAAAMVAADVGGKVMHRPALECHLAPVSGPRATQGVEEQTQLQAEQRASVYRVAQTGSADTPLGLGAHGQSMSAES